MSRSSLDLTLFKAFLEPLDREAVDAVFRVVNSHRNKMLLEKRLRKRAKRVRYEANQGATSQGKRISNFLSHDWNDSFLEFDNSDRKYCVYSHGDPSTMTLEVEGLENRMFSKPIYIGMGDYARPFNFSRSVMHTKALNDFMERGYKREDVVCILKSNLTEREARILESKLILYWGVSTRQGKAPERQKAFGRANRVLLNSRYEKIPDEYTDLM